MQDVLNIDWFSFWMFVPASADLVSCLTLQMPLRHFITPVWHVSVICMLLNLQLPAGSLAHGCNGLVQTYKQVRSLQQFKQTWITATPMETNLYIPYLVRLVLPVQVFLQCGNSPRAAPIFLAVLAAGGGCRRCAAGLPHRWPKLMRFHNGTASRTDLEYEKIDMIPLFFLHHGEILHLDVWMPDIWGFLVWQLSG